VVFASKQQPAPSTMKIGFLALLLSPALTGGAHTLPVSFLTVLCDADYAHFELRLNPFELSFFSELDRNHDGRLDAAELKQREAEVGAKISACLEVRVGQKVVTPDVVGFTPEADSHHITWLAHYPVDARILPLSIESTLAAITSGSHVIQLTLLRGGQRQLAQLDAHSARATFAAPLQAQSPVTQVDRQTAAARSATWLPWLTILCVIAWAVVWSTRNWSPSRPRAQQCTTGIGDGKPGVRRCRDIAVPEDGHSPPGARPSLPIRWMGRGSGSAHRLR
jgi:hypothetical protein